MGFPLLNINFKNDGNTSARLTDAALKSYSPSGWVAAHGTHSGACFALLA